MSIRQRRQYTKEGGWARDPNAYELVRDFGKDVGAAALRAFVRPASDKNERRPMHTGYYASGYSWSNREERRPEAWYRRVRTGRVGLAIGLAGAVLATAAGMHSTEAAPAPKPAAPTATKELVFSPTARTDIETIFAALGKYWKGRGMPVREIALIEVDDTAPVYICPPYASGEQGQYVFPDNLSEYCEGAHDIVLTASSYQGWANFMTDQEAAEFILAHEYGHGVQDLVWNQAQTAENSVASERQATCYAGAFIGTYDAANISAVYDAIANHAAPDDVHGSPEGQARAFMLGATGKSCDPLAVLQDK